MAMSRNKRGNWGGWVAAALIAMAMYTSANGKPGVDAADGGQLSEETSTSGQD